MYNLLPKNLDIKLSFFINDKNLNILIKKLLITKLYNIDFVNLLGVISALKLLRGINFFCIKNLNLVPFFFN